MNAGFRNLLGRRDTTRFKAYLLAIAVQMLLLPILQFSGLLQITSPAFYPLGATLGGFIFGMAMDWGGGCAAGVWYKLGAGNIGAFILKTSRGNPEPGRSWIKTGVVVGSIGVMAWLASSQTGRFFGMAVLPGCKDIFDLPLTGGGETLSWDFFFVLGIALGSFLSTAQLGKFSWSTLSGSAIWRSFFGGMVLGASASLAGGCTIGHGLTGIPVLSFGSIVFTIFVVFGVWAGVFAQKNLG